MNIRELKKHGAERLLMIQMVSGGDFMISLVIYMIFIFRIHNYWKPYLTTKMLTGKPQVFNVSLFV